MAETTLDKSSTAAVGNRDELDEQLAALLAEHAPSPGHELVGPDGLLGKLTKLVLETGLEAEMDEHLGYQAQEAVGRTRGRRSISGSPRLGAAPAGTVVQAFTQLIAEGWLVGVPGSGTRVSHLPGAVVRTAAGLPDRSTETTLSR